MFPDARHLGNASNLVPLELPEQMGDDVLIIASFDERFDFGFVADLAEICPGQRFHLPAWTRPDDAATMARIVALAARFGKVFYHGPYTMAELPAILSRYRISIARYRVDTTLTRFIDPLRSYHCLNAGLEVISTDIPQARYMADHVHLVSDATDRASTLAAIQAGRGMKQLNYTPITWQQRADRLVEILSSLKRTGRLRRKKAV